MISPFMVLHALLAVTAAHGVVKTPTPRTSGTAQVARCGTAVSKKLNNDPAGPIESAVVKADADYKCNAYLCRGYQYDDNASRVQAYTAGQVIPFYVDLVAAHKPGWANVSIIDLASNKALAVVKKWDVWPDDVPGGGDDVDFNITIPATLGNACSTGGQCALQWYWWSNSNTQTYISCVDFYVK